MSLPGEMTCAMTTNSVTLFAPPMVEAQSNVFVLAGGIVTRFTLIGSRGKEWYETRFMPRLGPPAMIGLLFTIVVMFSMQGDKILAVTQSFTAASNNFELAIAVAVGTFTSPRKRRWPPSSAR